MFDMDLNTPRRCIDLFLIQKRIASVAQITRLFAAKYNCLWIYFTSLANFYIVYISKKLKYLKFCLKYIYENKCIKSYKP